jgi:pSer/pThr/pTyr-binding forkhead associated (FHA) protein
MSKLILTFNKQVINEYPFVKDSVTVGRQQDNTIVIDNLAVSSYHARIDRAGTDFIVTDLQSTNGTFINNRKVVSHKLSHGDNILIGKHVILFIAAENERAVPERQAEKMDLGKTMLLETAKQRDLLSKQSPAPEVPKMPHKIGVINFVNGSDLGEVKLTKKLTKVGKAATSDIRLSGMLMGATAATISRRPSGYTITFTGGLTKLKVNGVIIKDSILLKDFDTIELGSHKFQFYNKAFKIP